MAWVTICALFLCASAAVGDETVKVGWYSRPGSFEARDGIYSGYSYEYLSRIAAYSGWQYEFVQGEHGDLIDMLKRGELDIVCDTYLSGQPTDGFDYSASEYGYSYTTLFTRLSSPVVAYDFPAFDGITVGVAKGSPVREELSQFARLNGFSYNEVEFDGEEDVKKAVVSANVDAGVFNAFEPDSDTRALASFSATPYYFAVRKGDDLLIELNRAMNKLKSAYPNIENELYEKHFISALGDRLTQEELDFIQSSQTNPVTIGIISSSKPACYWDEENGAFSGIFIEMFRLINQKTGLNTEFIPLDLQQKPPVMWVKSGYPDIVAGVLRTQAFMDDKQLAMSATLMEDSIVVVAKKGEDFTKNPDDRTLAIPAGFQVALEYAQKEFPGHKVITRATVEDCMNDVVAGRADAALYMRCSINYLLQRPYYENLEIAPTFWKDVETCAVGLSSEQTLLIDIINKGLSMISAKERNEMMMNYTIMNPYQLTISDLVYKYRMTLAIIMLLIIMVFTTVALYLTGRRKSSRALQKAYDVEKAALKSAEQASAAKGDFMSRMSHEIRTPLNAIIGYNTIARSEMSKAKTEPERKHADMKVMDCLTKSEIASKQLLTIINDVLDMSAIESGKIKVCRERFDFKGMINAITIMFYSMAKAKNVDFKVCIDEPIDEWFIGDQVRINQILTNLLSNAVKFTPENGSVSLSISAKPANGDYTDFHFEVKDTGIGMTREQLKHIFSPFEQADGSISRRFGGTGLGLSITRNLVSLMNGRIDVKSEPGAGSTFIVDLELKRAEQTSDKKAYDFSHINALVVDDDQSACDYIKLLFNRFGARCVTVNSGRDAIREFSSAKDMNIPFTLLFVDWHMPDMNGIETVKNIRKISTGDIPIVIATAYDYTQIAQEACLVGVNKFITKPIFQSTLFDLLANLGVTLEPGDVVKSKKYDFAGQRVLLAEDNMMNMEVAKRILESCGLTVDCAWNGREVVNIFAASPDDTYKAIIMDIRMPEMDGYEATSLIRASGRSEAKSIPIIAMTADAFSENVAQAYDAGMNDHISKPIDIQTLFETLGKYLHNSI